MRRRFTRGRKRSVAWIPGFSSYDDPNGVSNRLLSFAGPVAGSTSTWAVAVALTNDTDLSLHGGEDAVMTRIVGRVAFLEGRKNAGAGLAAYGFQARLVVYQAEPQGGLVTPTYNQIFTTSASMGQDRIMWSQDLIVSIVAIGAAGAGYDGLGGSLSTWTDVDIRAQRKVQSDSPIVFQLQSTLPVGTTGLDCRMLGGLRMLLKSPK